MYEDRSKSLMAKGLACEITGHEIADIRGVIRHAIKTGDLEEIKLQTEQLFEHLLDLSELSEAQLPLRETINFSWIEGYLKRRLAKRLHFQGWKCTFVLDEDGSITAHKHLLLPCLLKLAENAIYWAKSEIRITMNDSGITISDDGPGIQNERDLFQPFKSTRPCGRGIGLYLAKENALRMRFDLRMPHTVEEKILLGANFILDFHPPENPDGRCLQGSLRRCK